MNVLMSENKNGPVVLVSRKIEYSFPFAYAYLAGYLCERNEKVVILFKDKKPEQVAEEIIKLNPLVVGFGTLYPEIEEIRSYIEILNRKNRNFPVVIGGQMVTPIPRDAVLFTGADLGVIGEGEIILYNLVRALRDGTDVYAVKGLAVRKENEVTLTGPGEFIQDLSKLPEIPFEFFPAEQWVNIGKYYTDSLYVQPHIRYEDRVVNVHGSRGCPFKCIFCYHLSKVRYRPISVMTKEAKEYSEKFNCNLVNFADELTLTSPGRTKELIEGVKSIGRKISYSLNARIDTFSKLDDDLVKELKATGCRKIGFGFESGSDRILKLIGKNTTSRQILHEVERLERYKILPVGAFMIGHISETREDIEATIRLVKELVRACPNIQLAFCISTPFPGSEIFDIVFQKGYVKDHDEYFKKYKERKSRWAIRSVWNIIVNLTEMSDDEIYRMRWKAYLSYFGAKMRYLGIRVVVIEGLKSSLGIMNRIFRKLILNQLAKAPLLKKVLVSPYERAYGLVQQKLEHVALRLRGIDI